MATEWAMIRVRFQTRAGLERIRESLRRAAEQGQYEATNRHCVDISLDDVISELIRRDDSKRERAVKSRMKKVRAKLDQMGTQPVVDG